MASLRGRPIRQYFHRNLGTVATLGIGRGAFQSGHIGFIGFFAWLIHRAYHLFAVPTWERKLRVLAGWSVSVLFGRDIASVEDAQHPRKAFVRGGLPERHTTFMYDESAKTRLWTLHESQIEDRHRHKLHSMDGQRLYLSRLF